MKQRLTRISLVLMVLSPASAIAQNLPQVLASERKSVDLTVYNENISLVREERLITLSKGLNRVILPDVPASIDPTSLQLTTLSDRFLPQILEQNYEYDLVNQAALMGKYVGKEVEWIRVNQETKGEYSVKGKLLSTVGSIVAEINGKVELNPTGRMVLPRLPEGLVLRPQLEWLMRSDTEGTGNVWVSYLAGQISWSSDYVLSLHRDDSTIDVTAWITLNNRSGTSYRDAGLKLVAGDVNITHPTTTVSRQIVSGLTAVTVAPQFKQTNLFEYKLYSLQRRTDINNNETKQIEFASAHSVPARKEMVYDGLADQWQSYANNLSYRSQSSFGQQSNTKVGVYLIFKNAVRAGLGLPLPKGRVRVYKSDEEGKEQFVGEDMIDHTPKDENVRLYLGNAFDVVGERVQKALKTHEGGLEESIEITLRNHKSEDLVVHVYEHPWRWAEWKITEANVPWQEKDQSTFTFPVRLPKDEDKVVRYTIRYNW